MDNDHNMTSLESRISSLLPIFDSSTPTSILINNNNNNEIINSHNNDSFNIGDNYSSNQSSESIQPFSQSTNYSVLSLMLNENHGGKRRSKEVRMMVLRELGKKKKQSVVAKEFKVSVRTIRRWKSQWKRCESLEPNGSSGRPRTLWDEPVKKMLEALDKNPSATNEMLTAVVHNMICPRSVTNYLQRVDYSRKRIVDGGAQKMDDRIIRETRDFYLSVVQIPWKNRVYMDESFVYNNEALSMGRSKKGEPINRIRDKRGKRWTVYLAIRSDGLVHPPILKPLNADDKEFMKYVEQSLIPCLRPGEVVIWDRLGRSGRCKNPCKQHYNPLARKMIEEKGCHLMILPPKGKYFDPIELVFSLLKGEVRKTYGASIAAAEQRPRTEVEIREAVANASLKITSEHIFGFFKERANGRSFRDVYPHLVDEIFNCN